MKNGKAVKAVLVAALVAMMIFMGIAAGVDFQSSTISNGHGVVTSYYGLYNGPTFSTQCYQFDTTGAFAYSGSFKNGGQISWTVTPPKDPENLREYWEDKPAVFTSTFTRTGFPEHVSKSSGSDFINRFNAFGARASPTFKPISFPSF